MIIFDDIISTIKNAHGVNEVFGNIRLYLKKYNIDYYNLKNGNISNKARIFERLRKCDVVGIDPKYKIFHSTYYRIPNKKLITFNTVHDYIHQRYLKNFNTLINSYLKKKIFLNSDVLICVSHSTKKDLYFYNEKEVKNKRVEVIHNGVSKNFYRINDLDKKNFVLFVGRRGQYKNFNNVVKALSLNKHLKLIFTGGGPLSSDEKILLEKFIPGRYQHFKFCNQIKLNYLYNSAHCLIYSSLYEGFGLPIIEAQKTGCPVIAMNRSSVPEITNDSALLMEKGSADEILHSLNLLEDKFLKNKLIDKGLKNAINYDWDISIKKYIKLYKEYI